VSLYSELQGIYEVPKSATMTQIAKHGNCCYPLQQSEVEK